LPQANIPSILVAKLSFIRGPPVIFDIFTPALLKSSFSGNNPTDRINVSQGIYSSLFVITFLFLSIAAIVTPSTLSFPFISTMV